MGRFSREREHSSNKQAKSRYSDPAGYSLSESIFRPVEGLQCSDSEKDKQYCKPGSKKKSAKTHVFLPIKKEESYPDLPAR